MNKRCCQTRELMQWGDWGEKQRMEESDEGMHQTRGDG